MSQLAKTHQEAEMDQSNRLNFLKIKPKGLVYSSKLSAPPV